MHKNATKCNETIGKWCKNKHGASKIIDTFETYQAAAVEECREEYNIVFPEDPKVELSSVELMASIKGRLQPVAPLGSRLHGIVASIFKALWPGQAEPDTVDRLLLWMTLVSNQVDVSK
jgi:hypothetical protein